MTSKQAPRTNREATDCPRCLGLIAPYAGRAVSEYGSRFAHHPGQCVDRGELERDALQLARQTTLFAGTCRQLDAGEFCDFMTTDRAAFERHFRSEHRATAPSTDKPIRLRKRAPAARLAPLEVAPFKRIAWTHRTYSEWQPGTGQTCTETAMRGQFWSAGPDPHSVWVIPDPVDGISQRPVTLYLDGAGGATEDWSAAKRERREVTRRGAGRKLAA